MICGRYPSEAHHPTFWRGKGQKCPDTYAFSLCTTHHHQFHGAYGNFLGWSHHQRRAWQLSQVQIALYVFDDSVF